MNYHSNTLDLASFKMGVVIVIKGFSSQNITFSLFILKLSACWEKFVFGATLTGETNGIQSLISFIVSEDHDTTKIFCEDNDPSDRNISQCAVNILGMVRGRRMVLDKVYDKHDFCVNSRW